MPALLTTEETLAELRISRNTLWKRIHQGYITPVNENPVLERQRRHYFKREDVERLKREGIRRPDASMPRAS